MAANEVAAMAAVRPKHDVSFARHDPGHCLAPGLFRTYLRGDRRKQKLDVSYVYGSDTLRFIGFEPLGAIDLRILQGLVAFGGTRGVRLGAGASAEFPRYLRDTMEPTHDATSSTALVVSLSYRELLKAIGLTQGGRNFKVVDDSLLRLSNVTIAVERSGKRWFGTFHLLSFGLDRNDGRLGVALNPRLTDAILGASNWTMIDLDEVRRIRGDVTLLVHQRLCGWIAAGEVRKVSLDKIVEYVWGDEASAATVRQRRRSARLALAELESVGWSVTEYVRGKFELRRPKGSGAEIEARTNAHADRV